MMAGQAETTRVPSFKSDPFALSLSKGRTFLNVEKKGRCFDKLSTSGFGCDADLKLGALKRQNPDIFGKWRSSGHFHALL
jgi:hypothetical protein